MKTYIVTVEITAPTLEDAQIVRDEIAASMEDARDSGDFSDAVDVHVGDVSEDV